MTNKIKEELTVKLGNEPHKVEIKLNMRKTLDGKILIRDHERFGIVISTDNKIKTMPLEENDDITFRSIQRFFEFLNERGLIDPESIQGGNLPGLVQADYLQSDIESQDGLQVLLYNIYKYMEKEKPAFRYTSDLLKQQIKAMTDPPEEEATDPYAIKKKQDQYTTNWVSDKYSGMSGSYPYYGTYYYE